MLNGDKVSRIAWASMRLSLDVGALQNWAHSLRIGRPSMTLRRVRNSLVRNESIDCKKAHTRMGNWQTIKYLKSIFLSFNFIELHFYMSRIPKAEQMIYRYRKE